MSVAPGLVGAVWPGAVESDAADGVCGRLLKRLRLSNERAHKTP